MNFLYSFNNVIDTFLDYIDPIEKQKLSKDHAAYIIQRKYRSHLVKKYFNHMKHCRTSGNKSEIKKTNWFY